MPAPTQEDIDYLLGLLNAVVRRPVTADDVTFTFAGLRPLVRDQSVGGSARAKHPGFTFNFCVCRPDSRGDLTLRAPDAAAKPVIRANYLTAASDIRTSTPTWP